MDKYFSNISSTILKFTTNYHEKILNEILDSKDYTSEPKCFIYTVIRKTNDVLNALNFYIRNFDTHNHFQISIYILLRSILADIIVSEYVIIKGKNDIEREKIIKSIYLDHIDKTYSSIGRVYAKVKGWNTTEIDLKKKEFIKTRPYNFDENDKIVGKPFRTSPEKIMKIIFSQKPKDKNFRLLKNAFHYYDIFSKYEHLGDLSFHLIHRVYDSATIQNRFMEIYESINIVFSTLINYCNCWDEIFDNEKKELLLIQKEFHNMNPYKMPSV